MIRSFLLSTTALAFGALTGFLISDFPKLAAQWPTTAAKYFPWVAPLALAPLPKLPAASAMASGQAGSAAKAPASEVRRAHPVQAIGLVLKEPVVIVHGGDRDGTSLPTGTPVDLVKNEGRFLRVRHDQSVVTIPRSAVISGAARTN